MNIGLLYLVSSQLASICTYGNYLYVCRGLNCQKTNQFQATFPVHQYSNGLLRWGLLYVKSSDVFILKCLPCTSTARKFLTRTVLQVPILVASEPNNLIIQQKQSLKSTPALPARGLCVSGHASADEWLWSSVECLDTTAPPPSACLKPPKCITCNP